MRNVKKKKIVRMCILAGGILSFGYASFGHWPFTHDKSDHVSFGNVAQAMDNSTLNLGGMGLLKVGDPQQMNGTWYNILSDNIFEGLTTFNAKGKLVSGLAKSWEVKDNAKRFIFHLRPNLKWSNGTALTADDVVFSFRHLLDPKTGAKYASLMYPIVNAKEVLHGSKPLTSLGVKKINKNTVEFTTTNPTPFFPNLITHSTGDIIPKAIVLKYGKNWAKPQHIVTSGAYKISNWIPGGNLTLVANPKYYDARNVHIKTINYTNTTNLEPLINLFVTKKLDMVNGVLAEKVDFVESKRPHTVHIYKYPGIWYLAVNDKDPLLGGDKNTDIRHALAMSVKRQKILNVIKSHAVTSHTFVPEGVSGISHAVYPYWHKWSFAKRMQEAKKIMAKHGYSKKHPLRFKLEGFNSATQRKILVATFSYWKKIGVNATMDVYETNTHYSHMESRKFQMAFAGWVRDYDDAYDFLSLLNLKDGGSNDYTGYNNPIFNKYLDLAKQEGNMKKRGDLFVKAETQLMKDLPTIPLYYSVSSYLVSTHISGYYDNIANRHPLKYLQFK